MEKKCACGMPLDDFTSCSCNPHLCFYCCTCEESCSCACADNRDAEKESDEENNES